MNLETSAAVAATIAVVENADSATGEVAPTKTLKLPTLSVEERRSSAWQIGFLESASLNASCPGIYAKEVERLKKLISDSYGSIPFEGDDRFDELSVIRIGKSFEIALKRDGRIVYVDELGYWDVQRFDTEEEVLEEVARLEKICEK